THDVSIGHDGDADNGFSAQSVQISLAPASVFSGRPEITEIALGHPVLHLPLLRERVNLASLRAPSGRAAGEPAPARTRVVVNRLTVADGTIVFASRKDGVESRIEHIDLTVALAGGEGAIDAKARWDDRPVHLAVKGSGLADGLAGDSVPLE